MRKRKGKRCFMSGIKKNLKVVLMVFLCIIASMPCKMETKAAGGGTKYIRDGVGTSKINANSMGADISYVKIINEKNQNDELYNKLNVTTDLYLMFYTSKVENNNGEVINMEYTLLDENDNIIWEADTTKRDVSDDIIYNYSIGLKKGVYYLRIKRCGGGFFSSSSGILMYSCSVPGLPFYEKEPNNSESSSNLLATDVRYLGNFDTNNNDYFYFSTDNYKIRITIQTNSQSVIDKTNIYLKSQDNEKKFLHFINTYEDYYQCEVENFDFSSCYLVIEPFDTIDNVLYEIVIEESAYAHIKPPTPTQAPTAVPTQKPTTAPTTAPTQAPTTAPTTAPTQEPATLNGWVTENGKEYWYENGVRQGYDPNNASYRGKEIYDPGSDAWYWLDNVQQGAKAVSKDVYQESKADDAGNIGKWVRYDANGHMVKGWDYTNKGIFYFDLVYGTMYKGYKTINDINYYFDENTGVTDKRPINSSNTSNANGWVTIDGKEYWYENGVRQGTEGRGREIYDPNSNAWYWLDAVQGGVKTVNKDVYQESSAGQWAEKSDGTGKWVRYDENGHMIKGWNYNDNGTYYFDPTYGTMAKGIVTIDGKTYHFDEVTGALK